MAKPVIVVVDDDESSHQMLGRELESRYGVHYDVACYESAETALADLRALQTAATQVPLVLASRRIAFDTDTAFLSRVRALHPIARRGVLVAWGDRSSAAPIVEAAALGQIDFYIRKPAWSPDEEFHLIVTEALNDWWRPQGGRFEAVTVIGEQNSARSHGVRDILTRNSVPFGFYQRDSCEGVAALKRLGVEHTSGPVIALYNGSVLVDPAPAQVAAALGVDVQPTGRTYDTAIVGGGPAGLAAAVYGASEGLEVAVLEREAFGGQAGTSSLIRNYLGFPRGVTGAELASRAYEQAWTFGAHFLYGNPATSLRSERSMRVLGLADGSEVRSRTVIIATGVSYRRLRLPDVEAFVGCGVYYGSATVEAKAMSGKHAFVVGGGNSAGQSALHLAKYAEHVTILVRDLSLAASMSEYLIREIEAAPNIDVRHGVEVIGARGDGRLQQLELRRRASNELESVTASGLFILIGAAPFTEWLPDDIRCDHWGFIITGPDIVEGWREARAPHLHESTMPGVFAIGDVRANSVQRVASAVGEGSVTVRLIQQYLAAAKEAEEMNVGTAS